MKRPGLRYDSPVNFSAKQRAVLAVAPVLAYGVLRGIALSCRTTVKYQDRFDAAQQAFGCALVGFWHETLAIALNVHRKKGYHTLTSYSFDGELAARCCEAFGFHALRGSSSRGGSEGLRSLIRASQTVSGIGFTLDGPRGPRRIAKPGIAMLSAQTGIPVLPCAMAAAPCWRLRSWDRMAFPKPFGRIVCAFGEPVPAPPDNSADALEAHRLAVETGLNRLHAEVDPESGESA